MMNLKSRRLLLAAMFAIGISVGGAAAVSALTAADVPTAVDPNNVQEGQAGDQQTGESANDNKDEKEVDNKDEGQVGQAGAQETGESANENKDEGQVGEK
jgi:hypothetical protein